MGLFKKLVFTAFLLLIGILFFISETFTEIAAEVAILLFGMIMLEEGFNAFVQGPLQQWLQCHCFRYLREVNHNGRTTAYGQGRKHSGR